VVENEKELNDLEIFRRAALRNHKIQNKAEGGEDFSTRRRISFENSKINTNAKDDSSNIETIKYNGEDVPIQFGYPCEFKTSGFLEPWKFYTAYTHYVKQIDPHYTEQRTIRTIKGKHAIRILDEHSMKIKRANATQIMYLNMQAMAREMRRRKGQ